MDINRFNFRMASTRGFWSLFKLFEGIHDKMALDKLINSWSEHKCDMLMEKRKRYRVTAFYLFQKLYL